MSKVLIIAYRFPPQGGGGVQRTLKYVRYLRRFGWEPIVHTVKNPYWPLWDASLSRDVPAEVPVYRTRTFEFERLEKRLGNVLNGTAPKTPRVTQSHPGPALTEEHKQGGGAVATVRRLIHRRVLMPDPQIAWVPGALAKSLYLARKEQVAVVYTTSPPNSCQVLGLLLKRILKKPWVADFRDPWTDGTRRKEAYVGNLRRQRLEESWEHAIAEQADHFIVTADQTGEQFLAKHPCLAGKLTTLTNGFDPADFVHLSTEKKLLEAGYFHLTLTGSVEPGIDILPFFQAIQELSAENPEAGARLRVNFVGSQWRAEYEQYLAAHQLDRQIRHVAYVPHADSIQYLADSDVLFLFQVPQHAGVKLPGKLFEYLHLRKPVLALTLPGLAADILQQAGLGTRVDPNDVVSIKRVLADLYQQWQHGRWRSIPDEAVIQSFDRVRLTERLAAIFTTVME